MKPKSFSHQDVTRRGMMKSGIGAASFASVGVGTAVPGAISASAVTTLSIDNAQTQQPSTSAAAPNVTQPATGINMQPDYARTIAQMAYVWGWPIVNMLNRNAKITLAPRPGLLGGILPVAPRGQVGAQMEVTKAAQKAGILHAQEHDNGTKYRGRKPTFDWQQYSLVCDLLNQNLAISAIAKTTGLKRQSIYRIKSDPERQISALHAWYPNEA